MNSAYVEAKTQLAFEPPTHMSPGEWRRLVEGLVTQIERDRWNVLNAVANQLSDRVELLQLSDRNDGRIAGLNEAIDTLHALAK